jgi:mono/diheme cytochrome c family protein
MRYAMIAVLFACNDDFETPATPEGGSDARIADILALTGDEAAGQTTFDEKCSACHDATGQTDKVGPALDPWISVEGATEEQTLTVVLDGQGSMPKQTVTDQEAADLVAWMYGQWGGGSSGSDGAALFDDNCSVCHSTDGSPGVGPSMTAVVPMSNANNLTTVITDGLMGGMPAFGATLTPEEITAIVDWLVATF